MRYYLYLDRIFLRVLFSALETTDFNIEIVEFAVRQSNGTRNEIAISPHFEKGNDFNESLRNTNDEDKKECGNHSGNFSKEQVGVSYGYEDKCFYETERRYINIEDITDMKNTNFYHKLIENVRTNVINEESRICEIIGFIQPFPRNSVYSNLDGEDGKNGFLYINDTYIWYDKSKLEGDVKILSQMACKVRVIGYMMNCLELKEHKVLKAIAIFID